ncbi:MAG: BTAD domain-containing putative transcriptional regulator [Solirubrobacteraceae bacterium]
MEFMILGPFEVLERGQKLALGAAGQQALLAVLLLHRDQVVASDRLIDLLWGEHPPRTAAKTVQVYVSRLRNVLGDQLLQTEGRGYRLVVAADRVDAERFERLSREGRAEFDAGDARRAVGLFGDALELWRGAPLADFAYERFARAEIERLAELKLAVIEDRLDAELTLGGDGRLVPELEVLVGANPLRERLRGQLMLALYRAGRHSDALAVYRQASTILRDELGLDPSPALRELERRILDHDPSLSGGERAERNGGAMRPALCPFKGIGAFDRFDAGLFFGRERVVGDLVARVAEGDLVGIIGPSGIGKSSLLRAGVLAALSGGALPGSGRWRQVLLRPGEHPADQLLNALGGVQLDAVLDSLPAGERLVIAVDQFEELFTQCESEPERRRMIAALATAARDADRRAVVIVALRSDFYGRLAPYQGFAQLLSRSHVLVGPMDQAELASAIEKPATLAGLDVDERLVDELVSDVAGELGGLPLLSAALLELWRAGEGRALRLETYRASGGIHAAVARLAEDAYGQLDEPAREIARSVMLRLAGEQDGTPTRRRAPAAELEAIDGAAPVLATLIDARLLTQAAGSVELTHEALLLHWPRYAEWRAADRVGNQIRAHLATAAREWDAHSRDTADVYRGARLAGVLDWAAQHGDQLNPLEHAFIDASRIETDREQRRQQLQNRRLRELLGIAGVLACAAVVAAIVAVANQQSANAKARRVTAADRVAVGRELTAQAVSEPDLRLAMKMAREAVALDGSAEKPECVACDARPVSGDHRRADAPGERHRAAPVQRL